MNATRRSVFSKDENCFGLSGKFVKTKMQCIDANPTQGINLREREGERKQVFTSWCIQPETV